MRLWPRGLLLTCALAVGAIGAMAAASSAVRAGPPELNGNYLGVTAPIGGMTFKMEQGAAEVGRFVVRHYTDVGAGCDNQISVFQADGPMRAPMVNLRFLGEFNSNLEIAAFSGTFDDDGLVRGTYESISPVPGRCTPRKLRWLAIYRPEGSPTPTSTSFSGTTSDGGTVTFVTSADAGHILDVAITPAARCATIAMGSAGLSPGGASEWIESDTAKRPVLLARVAVSGSHAAGAYVVDRPEAGCPLVMGAFTARSTGPAPTASPAATAAPPARFSSGSVPAAGFGLVVFGGGQATQLSVASGCTAATLTAFVSVGGGWVGYVPAATVAAANAAFLARFPGGVIPAGTALLVRCL